MISSSMNKTVLISGITGFLGSSLGDFFINHNFNVIGLKRSTSNTWRCVEYYDKIQWIDVDNNSWQKLAINSCPDVIIHAAWHGVTAETRNDLHQQLRNLELTADLLLIAQKTGVKQFIGLGSQAEYGQLNRIVTEEDPLLPDTAYGTVKIMTSNMIELFCRANNIAWFWLRIFSVFGEKESEDWLIPSAIKKMILQEDEILLSDCNQKYAYMYVNDFAKIIYNLVERYTYSVSGVYNVSSKNAISLKNVLEKIKIQLQNSITNLNFGSLSTRPFQSMHLEGNMDKFRMNVSDVEINDFDICLNKVVLYYTNRYKSKID